MVRQTRQQKHARRRGFFLVLDGPDGGGKTTQAKLLAAALRRAGRAVLLTREPGGTPLGEALRRLILHRRDLPRTVGAELLLFMAARAELVATVIRPALAAGKVVIADRFLDSSIVYQGIVGGLGGLKAELVGSLTGIRTSMIDLLVLLDVPAAEGLARSRRKGRADAIESRGRAYHERVRRGFRQRAAQLRRRGFPVLVLDARRPVKEVAAAVLKQVRDVLG